MVKIDYKKTGFTLIELTVVIALVAILAVTLTIKIKPILDNSKVSRVLHYLGMIRSKISYNSIELDEYPDLVTNDIGDNDYNENSDLLYEYDVHPTESFSFDRVQYDETDRVVGSRDNKGGWYYIKESGEVYANLPNGAYTGKEDKEIWNDTSLGFTLEDLKKLGIELDENGNYKSNGDFEDFDQGILDQFENGKDWRGFDPSKLGNWETEDPNRNVELWKSGFLGVDAVSGDYFMELNSNGKNSIYQDIKVVPGTTIEWSVSHRGRNGEDTAAVRIGSRESESITNMTTGKDGWKEYSGSYTVPEGQTTLRIYIDSVDSKGSNTVGNLLDNFSVGVKLD